MALRSLAHLSDLHIGRDNDTDERAHALCEALTDADIHHVVVTGDVTHSGRRTQWDGFRAIFAPLSAKGRLTVVPGNHDRLNDDVGAWMRSGVRVSTERFAGLFLVCVDSTGPHNRNWVAGHGRLAAEDIEAIEAALHQAPDDAIVALLLHHHLLPLPCEHPFERLSSWLGWPFAEELETGPDLLSRIRGRCDLVLHGHRHCPASTVAFSGERRPLFIYNAGSSTELTSARVFSHARGGLIGAPVWLSAHPRAVVSSWTPDTQPHAIAEVLSV